MIHRITIDIRKGIPTVRTKKLRLSKIAARPETIDVVIRDYDIEGGSCDPDVIKRGYTREIVEILVE